MLERSQSEFRLDRLFTAGDDGRIEAEQEAAQGGNKNDVQQGVSLNLV